LVVFDRVGGVAIRTISIAASPLRVACTCDYFVVTAEDNAIRVFDSITGAEVRKFGSKGTGPLQFDFPGGVAIVGERMWITDGNNNRCQLIA